MSKKILSASYESNEFDKRVFTDATVYTKTLAATTATKITNDNAVATCTRITLAGNILATTIDRIQFTALRGNLPYSSYSKFAYTEPRTTSPSIPLTSLPKSGSISLTDGVNTEVIYYGSITWTAANAGYLNNIKRAATAYAFLAATPTYGYFTNVIPVREYVKIWNRTGAVLYIGADAAINATPTNAVQLAIAGEWGMWLEPLVELWCYSTPGGAINIAEYR